MLEQKKVFEDMVGGSLLRNIPTDQLSQEVTENSKAKLLDDVLPVAVQVPGFSNL